MAGSEYQETLALIIISSISIGMGACVACWIAVDILIRRGWKSLMLVMIPVYIINALYLFPITIWVYLHYGRPAKPDVKVQTSFEDAESMGHDDPHEMAHQHQHQHQHQNGQGSSGRPIFATITIGVCHCGAGCVLGDLIGEWLVYGTNAAIGHPPRLLWTEYLVDFAFAFAFGIIFQYLSIAPMTNDKPTRVLMRALKADALSLLFFEIGLFGWMAAFQIGIFQDTLPITTVTYWWMMQIGMFIGHWTGVPINWWLITRGIKEPCA